MTTFLMMASVGAVIVGGTILGWLARAHLSGVDLNAGDNATGPGQGG